MNTNAKPSKKLSPQKRWSILLASSTMSAIALAACAPPIQMISDYSAKTNVTQSSEVFATTEHTANFFKTPKQKWPNAIDARYTDFWAPIDPGMILEGRSYRAIINKLSVDDIRNDLLDSLIDLVNNVPNITIDFSHKDEIVKPFSLSRGSRGDLLIDALQLRLTVSNSGLESFNFMNGIEILPQSVVKVQISLPQGKIAPSYGVLSNQDGSPNSYAASWNIEARAFNFVVNLKYVSGDYANKEIRLSPQKLQFLTSRSYAINEFYNNFRSAIDYNTIKESATKKIANLTSEEIKKDINDWWMTYFRFQAYKGWKDVELIFKYLMTNNQIGDDGQSTSLLHILTSNKARKDQIFSRIYLPDILKQLINAILDEREGYTPPTYDQMHAFLQDILAMNVGDFFDQGLKIDLVWNQEPEINSTNPTHPQVSFDYTVKVTFLRDLQISFTNKTKAEAQNKIIIEENKSLPSNQQKALVPIYDVNKFLNVETFVGLLNDGAALSPTSMMGQMMQSLSTLIKFDQVGINKGEAVEISFKAKNSQMQFTTPKSLDMQKENGVNFGWEASDVTWSINLSKVHSLWVQIYKHLNAIDYSIQTPTGADLITNIQPLTDELNGLADGAKNGKIEDIFKLLSALFVSPDFKGKSNSSPIERPPRPVEVLFDALVNKTYTINSAPMGMNLTRAFYYLPDKFKNKPLWMEISRDNKSITYQSNSNLSLIDLVPTQSQNSDLGIQISESNFDPSKISEYADQDSFTLIWKDPYLHNLKNGFSHNQFSAKSLIFKTDIIEKAIDAAINAADNDNKVFELPQKIVGIIKQNVVNYDGSASNYYDDFDPKVSLIQLPLSEAIKTVLSMDLARPLSTWIDLIRAFRPNAFDISGMMDNAFIRNAYVVFVNLKVGYYPFYWTEEGRLRTNSPTFFFRFLAPIFDAAEIKIPSA